MKSFDTKDLKVSNRKFESSHTKHSEMEESPNDFPEVSIRKFESSHRKDPESECSPDGVWKVPNRKFESSHRKHSELEESLSDFHEVSTGKFDYKKSFPGRRYTREQTRASIAPFTKWNT